MSNSWQKAKRPPKQTLLSPIENNLEEATTGKPMAAGEIRSTRRPLTTVERNVTPQSRHLKRPKPLGLTQTTLKVVKETPKKFVVPSGTAKAKENGLPRKEPSPTYGSSFITKIPVKRTLSQEVESAVGASGEPPTKGARNELLSDTSAESKAGQAIATMNKKRQKSKKPNEQRDATSQQNQAKGKSSSVNALSNLLQESRSNQEKISCFKDQKAPRAVDAAASQSKVSAKLSRNVSTIGASASARSRKASAEYQYKQTTGASIGNADKYSARRRKVVEPASKDLSAANKVEKSQYSSEKEPYKDESAMKARQLNTSLSTHSDAHRYTTHLDTGKDASTSCKPLEVSPARQSKKVVSATTLASPSSPEPAESLHLFSSSPSLDETPTSSTDFLSPDVQYEIHTIYPNPTGVTLSEKLGIGK